MEPSEALSTAAQIAVALAGFAGVVVVFRRESVHKWTPIDKYRLRLLLMNSILPLAFCTVGLLLLTVKPLLPGIWRWCSVVTLVIVLPFAITTTKGFRRLDPQQLQSVRGTGFGFYLFGILGTGALESTSPFGVSLSTIFGRYSARKFEARLGSTPILAASARI